MRVHMQVHMQEARLADGRVTEQALALSKMLAQPRMVTGPI